MYQTKAMIYYTQIELYYNFSYKWEVCENVQKVSRKISLFGKSELKRSTDM